MKRFLACFLAIIIALSVVFSVPSIFSSVYAEELVINNTYDESGYANNDTNFDTKSSLPIVKVVAEGRTGNALQFMRVYGSARCSTLPYTNIYDSNKSDYSFFKPTIGDTYSLTLWYNPKHNTRNIALELYGVKNADLSDGVKLADICQISKGLSKEWRKVSVAFTVNEEFKSLAIATNSFRTDSGADQYYTLIDDIKLERIPAGDTTITIHHNVDETDEEITLPNSTKIDDIKISKRVDGKRVEGLYTDNTYTTLAGGIAFGKTELWAKWIDVPSKVENTYDEAGLAEDKLSKNNIFHFGTKSAATPNTTKVVQFNPIAGQTNIANGTFTYVEIYDPNSNFNSFITEPDADYKINFDFKTIASSRGDISFNIREVVNGKVGEVLSTAAKVVKGDADYSAYTWGKAEAVVSITKPNTALAISIEITTNNTANLFPYLDNIVVEKVTDGDTTLTIHHNADSSDEQITVPNKTLVNEIVITKRVDGKRVEGFYTDDTYSTLAKGIVFGKTELWAKWVDVPSKIENNYEDAGLTKAALGGNNIFYFGTKAAAEPNDTSVVQFYPIVGQVEIAKGNLTYVEIYDPNSNFNSFITEPDADYKINFDFKVKVGTNGDISFNIREVVNGEIGKIIGTAATVVKGDEDYSAYTWGKAETVVAITKPNTALAISIETTINNNGEIYPYLDNIVVEKVKNRKTVDLTVNNYKNDGKSKKITISKNALFTQIELDAVSEMEFMGLYTDEDYENAAKGKIGDCTAVWAKWRDVNIFDNTYDEAGLTQEKLKGKDITFLGARGDVGREGKVLQFNKIAGQNSISESTDNITRVEIYDPNSSEFESFTPEVNTTYFITFDYKQRSTLSDIEFNIREVVDGKVGDILGTAAVIKAGDPKFTTAVWAKAEAVVTVTKPNTVFAITIEYKGNSDGVLWPYLDNVVIDKVSSPTEKKELIIHNFDGSNDKTIELPNATLFSSIEIPVVIGRKYEGLYFNKECTKPVEGMISRCDEVWVKWGAIPSKVENTYDEEGLTKGVLKGNKIFHFGTKATAEPDDTSVVQFYPIAGQVEIAKGNFTYVEIYDPNSNFNSFITEADADYKINFDFKVKGGTYGNIIFNIREVVDGKIGNVIGTAATVVKGDEAYKDYAWGKAETVVAITKPNTALAISIETTINNNGEIYPYLDNIVVEKVKNRKTVDLTVNNYKNNGKSKKITISKNALFTQIELDAVSGTNFMGLYTDEDFKNAAKGKIGDCTAVWAKWRDANIFDNTYDEAGLTKGVLKGNNIFHFGTKAAAEPNDTSVVQFYPIVGQVEIAKGNFTYVEIYDPNSNFNSFITEPDADYKINFDFKVKGGTYGNISFNIREVVDGKIGNVIGTAATVVKGDEAYKDYAWGKAETVVAITKPNTALAISIETTINNNGEIYPYLDNIVVEKVKNRKTIDITINNYKNNGKSKKITISKNALFTQIELDAVSGMNFMGLYTDEDYENAAKGKIGDCTAVWAKWRDANIFDNTYDEPGLTKEKLKGKDITFLGARDGVGHEGKVLQFNKIAGQNSISESTDNITRVEIFNPNSTEFESFTPEVNATYFITFDYKQRSILRDIRFNIREVVDGKVGDILSNAAVIKAGDPKFTTAVWAKAEAVVTVTKPNTVLAITIEYTGDPDGALWPYLDNVVIDKIPSPTAKKELIIHNYDGSNDKKIKLPNATLFSSIEIPIIHGKKYEGLYFDKECTKPVEGIIYRHNEVWAKWRTSADSDKIVNNYDDKGVYYKEELNLDRFDEKFELTESEEKKSNNYITRYSDSGLKHAIDSDFIYQNFAIGSIVDGRSGKAIQLNSASVASVTKPPLVRIYDNRDGNKKIYKPRPNTLYKIEFYVKSTQLVSKDMHIAVKGYSDQANEFGKGDFLKYCLTIKNGTVVKDWVKVETYFTVPDIEYDFLGISLMASGTAVINGKNSETETYNVQVSIDDVSVTEVFDTYYLIAEPNNGEKSLKVPFMAGELLDTIPAVKRDGYVFAGWFTDAALKTPFTYGKMPAKNVNVYGKWEKVTDSEYNFSTGFEKGDFSVSYPYTNTDKNKLYSNNMSSAVTVVTNSDDVHDGGEKYLHFEIDPASSRQTMDMAAVALLNPDGTAFQVVKGTRYTIDFSLRCDTDCYIVPVVSDQVPTGRLNLSNSTEINRTWFRPYWYHNKEEWGTMKNVFVPNTSGRVYLLVYYGSTYVDIDNVEIKCATSKEVVQVKFYNEEGTGVKKTITGRVGDWMFPPVPNTKEGFVFDGWFDAMDETGKVYESSVLPGDDIKLYPRYRKATPEGDEPSTVKEEGIKIDFEGDNARKLAFYQSNNDNWIGNNDVIFVVNDPKGAHSGSNYFKFNNAGQWEAKAYRRFRFYNENTSDNRAYLEPLSVYKIGFWMKVDRTWSAGIRIASFDTTDEMGVLSNQQVVALTEVETEDDYGKWIYYEGELTTGSEISTAGIMLSGGFLTASIDDITVRKMKKLVVSFDSCGGTPVGSLETFENQCVVAPIEPEREGYYFGGWHTEKDCKNLFDFNNTPITKNITLYAKWIKIEFKDVTTYEIEEIIKPLPTQNPELDDQLKTSIAENDPVKPSSQPEKISNESNNILWIVILVSGIAIVIIACGVLAVILIRRHKKKR